MLYVSHGRILLFSLLFVCIVSAGCARRVPGSPPAAASQPPLVDLTHIRFADDTFVMPVQWDFYWKRFVLPGEFTSGAPDARFVGMRPWTTTSVDGKSFPGRGFATYRMLVRLPPGELFAFRLQQQLTAFRVFVDGELRVKAGRPGKSRAETIPERKQHTLHIEGRTGPIEVVLHVANYHMFRGGLRGVVVVGRRAAVAQYANSKIVLDLVLLGFLTGIFLYHLAFYFMHPRDLYFLLFALLSLSYALRIPFMSEKTILLVYSGIPWDWHLRTLGTINIISPAALMLFVRSLYPDGVSRGAVLPYVLLALVFLCVHFLELIYLAPVMFVSSFLFVPVVLHAGWIVVRLALRGNTGALWMVGAIFAAAVFGFLAMYLNWRAADAAPMAMFAFAISILLQSFGVGRTYHDSLEVGKVLAARLIRSQEALIAQRKELEINLHDSLGGALTDLRILVRRGLERLPVEVGGPVHEHLSSIKERLDGMSRMFRGQLLFMEDMELVARDPATGLHMTLLRRYSEAERELVFEISDEAWEPFIAAMSDDNWRLNVLQFTRELCTNDLKYGRGESRWSLTKAAEKQKEFLLVQSNMKDTQSTGSGSVPRRALDRARKLGGVLDVKNEEDRFSMFARLPYR